MRSLEGRLGVLKTAGRHLAAALISLGIMYSAGCEEEESPCCEELECDGNYGCHDIDEDDRSKYSKTECIEWDSGRKDCCACMKIDTQDYPDYGDGWND